jgi:ferritin-like metal-binding protein YciE
MAPNLERELISCLRAAHAIEHRGLALLCKARKLAGDERIEEIYRCTTNQTEEHARHIAQRLEAHGGHHSLTNDTALGLEALEVQIAPETAGRNSAMVAMTAYAFENLEIAAYHLLRGVAERAGDPDSVAAAAQILEQEEEAAELLASIFDRALEVSLGERGAARKAI